MGKKANWSVWSRKPKEAIPEPEPVPAPAPDAVAEEAELQEVVTENPVAENEYDTPE